MHRSGSSSWPRQPLLPICACLLHFLLYLLPRLFFCTCISRQPLLPIVPLPSSIRLLEQRVTRPSGGINKWLHWLPVSLHKSLNSIVGRVFGASHFQKGGSSRIIPLSAEKSGINGLDFVSQLCIIYGKQLCCANVNHINNHSKKIILECKMEWIGRDVNGQAHALAAFGWNGSQEGVFTFDTF